MKGIVACLLAWWIPWNVSALSEAEAIQLALEHNPDIRISRITLRKDSLSLESVKSDASWQAVVTGENAVELHPSTKQNAPGYDKTQRGLETNLGGQISRHFPGGGRLNASVSGNGSKIRDSSGANFSTVAEISVTQPLLKNAWSNAPLDYQINVAKNNFKISREQFKKEIRDALSQIRERYLDLISAVQTVKIRETELIYAENALKHERSRLLLGEKAEMDTLTAALEYLRAGENLMSAEYAVKTARRNFALIAGLPTAQAEAPEGVPIEINPLPGVDAIMAQIKENDDRMAILEITRQNLVFQRNKHRNALLPEVDVEAGLRTTRYGDIFFASDNATPFRPTTLDPWIGIRFAFDLLGKKDRYAGKNAELSLQSNKIEKERLWKELSFDVEAFVDAWAQDSARLAIRSAEIEIASKNHDYAIARYEVGQIDNLAKLKAQNDLISARLNKLLAEVNLKKLEIAVDQATYNVFNRFGVTVK